MINDVRGIEGTDMLRGIAKAHGDHWHVSRAGRRQIDVAVADHHGALGPAAGLLDGAQQMRGMRFVERERVAAREEAKAAVRALMWPSVIA